MAIDAAAAKKRPRASEAHTNQASKKSKKEPLGKPGQQNGPSNTAVRLKGVGRAAGNAGPPSGPQKHVHDSAGKGNNLNPRRPLGKQFAGAAGKGAVVAAKGSGTYAHGNGTYTKGGGGFNKVTGGRTVATLGTVSRQERKQAQKARKTKYKKNFGLVQEAVVKWERLRPKNVSKEEKQQLAHEIVGQVRGKVSELADNPRASRVIQFCARDGSDADKKAIFEEVKANVVALSKGKYAHHIVRKMINVCSKEDVPGVLKLFKGHVGELLRHPRGCEVMMDLYEVASSAQRNALVAELYGREYALFDGVYDRGEAITSLKQVLDAADPDKRVAILQHLTRSLMPIMEKALLQPPMVHRLVRDFLQYAPPMSVEDAVETLAEVSGAVLKMVHTHEGATAACAVLAYGTTKDRKKFVKAMKGYVMEMALNEWAHAVVLTALTRVDDTALLNKNITASITDQLPEVLGDKHARRVLLQLLNPDSTRYLPPHILAMIHPPEMEVQGARKAVEEVEDAEQEGEGGEGVEAGEESTKEEGPRVLGASRKDPRVRRCEVLGGGGKGKGLGAALCALCTLRAPDMLRSAGECDVLLEVATGAQDGVLSELCADGVQSVQDALRTALMSPASVASTPPAEEGDKPSSAVGEEPLLTSWHSSRALRRLVLMSAPGPGQEPDLVGSALGPVPARPGALHLTQRLWSDVLQGRCRQWMGSHAEKVLAAFTACGDGEVRTAALAELRPLVKAVKGVKGDVATWTAAFTGQGVRGGAAEHAVTGVSTPVVTPRGGGSERVRQPAASTAQKTRSDSTSGKGGTHGKASAKNSSAKKARRHEAAA